MKFIYDGIYNTTDNLWNFMFFTGYLKKVDERMNLQDERFLKLKIPNKEVKYIFRDKILEWFNAKVKSKDLSSMYNAIAVILEFKVAEKIKELDKKCDEALNKIKEKEYDLELKSEGYENIIKYGIAC